MTLKLKQIENGQRQSIKRFNEPIEPQVTQTPTHPPKEKNKRCDNSFGIAAYFPLLSESVTVSCI